VSARPGSSPESVVKRLSETAPSLAAAEGARRESAPWAYRVLARQLGSEPLSREPTPESGGLPTDALTIATNQTGVPLLAFDSAELNGELALRRARAGEQLAEEGQVVIADREKPVAIVLGPQAHEVTTSTERVTVAAIQAKGVPTLAVEEALWTAIEIMRERR
jgi:hypothetical protein